MVLDIDEKYETLSIYPKAIALARTHVPLSSARVPTSNPHTLQFRYKLTTRRKMISKLAPLKRPTARNGAKN